MSAPFFGKYRGVVTDNRDPLFLGRVRARVNDVLGDRESGWALPCLPFAGRGVGFFAIPPVGSGVWVEFEKGDPEFPIWVGGWFAQTDVPPEVMAPPYQKLLLKTEGGNSIVLDDTPGAGGITLQAAGGQKLTLTALGVELNGGQQPLGVTIATSSGQKITLAAAGVEVQGGASVKVQGAQVDVNNGALTVI